MKASADELWVHAPVLHAIARRRCRNAADADDLVQETFMRALRRWDAYDDRGSLRGWLVTIIHRLSVDRRRRAMRAPPLDDIDRLDLAGPEPTEPPLWTTMPIERVQESLALIPPMLRTTFELHVEGHSYDEIARTLQIPKNTVGTRLFRTRRRIQQLLAA